MHKNLELQLVDMSSKKFFFFLLFFFHPQRKLTTGKTTAQPGIVWVPVKAVSLRCHISR